MEFHWIDRIDQTDRGDWNRLTTRASTPLLSWEWLNHLEQSGSVTPENGWVPHHLIATEDGRLAAAAPLYIRDTSWGEFVFDFLWMDAAEQLKTPYYPKLVGMSPLTPSTAYRFLVSPDLDERATTQELISRIVDHAESLALGVVQFNYVEPDWLEGISDDRFALWRHHGFQWHNESYRSFEEFLGRFTKNARRNIRRERASMGQEGIRLEMIHGTQAPTSFFSLMAEYYHNTNDQFGPYAARFLQDRFFTDMPEEVRRLVWFSAAYEEGASDDDPVALAMLVAGENKVLGRYWGTRRFVKDLHFNVCYYEPIRWTIDRGLAVFDPGMGSRHKVRRGFRSQPNYSMHYFLDRRLQAVLQHYIDSINEMEDEQIRELDGAVPFKAR